MPTFRPPTVDEGIQTNSGLFRHYSMPRGVSVAVTAGVATTIRFPSIEEIDAADEFYVGGYDHPISDAQAAVLTANGFGAYIS